MGEAHEVRPAARDDGHPEHSEFATLGKRYLLVTNIPHYVDAQGDVFLERAWHHDVLRHVAYLPQLTIASPLLPFDECDDDLVRVDDGATRFVALPPQRSFAAAVRALPSTLTQMYRAVGDADIVHSAVVGWPYPLGWLASVFAKARGRRLVVIVESAPWRLSNERERQSPRKRMRALVYEQLARWTCKVADLALFTQPAYRETLLPAHPDHAAYVTPATWINAENVLSDKRARKLWRAKAEIAPRFLFASRLTTDKGSELLLEALRELEQRGVAVQVDVIGTGACEAEIDACACSLRTVRLTRLRPLPYGPEFFSLVDRYHAVLVPNLSDEQPRIFFDAAARAVPAIAADTDGLRPHVEDLRTGILFPKGDARALADALQAAVQEPSRLEQLGMAALTTARSQTHTAMHARRSQLLAAHVG
jgi:glycosyltransferase involved in cell wall biosynthesis